VFSTKVGMPAYIVIYPLLKMLPTLTVSEVLVFLFVNVKVTEDEFSLGINFIDPDDVVNIFIQLSNIEIVVCLQ
tara:strand:- start:210 stop:431 length:222 start_codon:yes stop_codon:yes gene_type:complete